MSKTEERRDSGSQKGDALEARLAHLTEKLAQVEAQFGQAEIRVALLRKVTRLASSLVKLEALPQQFLGIIQEHLKVNRLALFKSGEEASQYMLRAEKGFPEGLAGDILDLTSPADFLAIGCDTPSDPQVDALRQIAEAPEIVFVSPADSGLALLLAHDGDGRDKPGFFSGADRKIFEDILTLFSEISAHLQCDLLRGESEEMNRSIVERASDGIAIICDGHIAYVNSSMCEMLGFSSGEMTGVAFLSFIAPEEQARIERSYPRYLSGEEKKTILHTLARHKEGRNVDIEINVGTITYGGEQAVLALIRDTTERNRLEQQLYEAQKMDAIGKLAGGVAHDFNNLLTSISGYTEFLLAGLDPDDPRHKDALHIMQGTKKAASLTHQLLAFSRKQVLQPIVLDLNSVIVELSRMVRRIVGEDIKIQTILDPGLRYVKVDPGQIDQMIMNLVVNARYAMSEGGMITIMTESMTLDEKAVQSIPESRVGDFACLTIEDTGEGMDEDMLKHIFEPFYRNAPSLERSGLGLAAIYGIVKQHDGWINVVSQEGAGTAFKIFLPVFTAQPKEAVPMALAWEMLRGKGERILLVEDEENVRVFVTRMLTENGYSVFQAEDAERAMEIFEDEEKGFHLVFSDVVLPGMNGLELVDLLRTRQPDLKVILCSGYVDGKSRWSHIRERGIPFVQKPFSVTDLLNIIRNLLN